MYLHGVQSIRLRNVEISSLIYRHSIGFSPLATFRLVQITQSPYVKDCVRADSMGTHQAIGAYVTVKYVLMSAFHYNSLDYHASTGPDRPRNPVVRESIPFLIYWL